MLEPTQLYDYQRECIMHQICSHDSMLWLQVGLGKTIITLTTIVELKKAGLIKRVLIWGPLRVVQSVWEREARKWSHTKHLTFSVIHGTPDKRERALFADCDIFLINYENMNWLAQQLDHYYVSQGHPLPFDMVVYDEVSKLKNSNSLRMAGGNRDRKDKHGNIYKIKVHGWRKLINMFKYRTGLTGTPASNGYLDLFGQYLAVDGGQRLGEYVTHYKDNYFMSDYNGWTYTPTDLGKQWIEHKISDITKKMDAKDYLDLPACKTINMFVDLPEKVKRSYKDVEKNMFTMLDSGKEIEVFSRSSVSNKCLQFCIAKGTKILTDSGWKNIELFKNSDLLWDGVEWVSASGLTFQGVKDTIEIDGVLMTPNHKVLTISGWKEAQEVLKNETSNRFNRAKVRIPDSFETARFNIWKKKKSNVACKMYLWKGVCSHRSKFEKPKQTRDKILRLSARRNNTECYKKSWNVKKQRWFSKKGICYLDKYEIEMSKPERQRLQKIWRAWYNNRRYVVQFFFGVLERHGANVSFRFIHRKNRQQQRLLQRKLQMGNDERTGGKQEKQHLHKYTNGRNDSNGSIGEIWFKKRDNFCANKKRMGRIRFNKTKRISETYDIVNSGPRNRFTVMGKNGEVFIVHNCNGNPYLSSDSDEFESIHDAKLDALESILEEAAGQPVLCSYSFKSDAKTIMKRFKKYKPVNLTAEPAGKTGQIIDNWNSGKIKLLIGHPASMGHGIDGLQDSGSIVVWFGINWSLELYDQMNGRINRQGQKQPVSIIRILCRNTVDLAVADAIERKDSDQEGLKRALQRYRDGHTTDALEVNFY